MAIEQTGMEPGAGQRLGVDVGATAGAGSLGAEGGQTALEKAQAALGRAGGWGEAKPLKPLPHAVLDYAMAGTMLAAPWLFGFSRNRAATAHAVASGAAILGLSLMTKYPLGAVKAIPFPVHGVVETGAGVMTAAAPWLMGFSRDKSARLTHLFSGLGTLAVVALTDYRAAEEADGGVASDEAA